MAPKKTVAAGGYEGVPVLKLCFEEGPISGQTNDFKPGSKVRIGRVVTGNTLSIKDAGISSKHLLFQVESAPNVAKTGWTVTDLGSSNGTVLNSEDLQPSKPTLLSDGDVIQIGEQTSIKVKFEVSELGNSKNPRRNASRRAKKQVVDLGVIEEEPEVGLLENGACDVTESASEFKDGVSESKDGELQNVAEEIELKKGIKEKISSRRTRNSRKEETSKSSIDDAEKSELISVIIARSSKNKVNLREDSNARGGREGPSNKERVHRTRSSTIDGNIDDILIDLDVAEGRRAKKGKSRGKNVSSTEKTTSEEKEKVEDEVDKTGSIEVSENAVNFASTCEVQDDAEKDKEKVDLEKMTLGEWIDFLEEYLPKQVIQRTEEMISDMKVKAETAFLLQRKKDEEL